MSLSNEQKAKRDFDKITKLGGSIKNHMGIDGVWFDGPPEAPENALFIPLPDFGYSKKHGIFRKSHCPDRPSEINL
jgi:hypothetical protein